MDDAVNPPQPHSKLPLGAALHELAERQRRELGPHLEADELVAYHEQELSAADAERVRDHLALCPECAGLLLELDAFSAPSPAGAPDLTTAEVEAAWRELAPRLAEDPPPVVRLPRRRLVPVLPWALAAALFSGIVGLSIWSMALRGELRDRSQPQATVMVDLRPAAEMLERSGPARRSAPSSRRTIALVLHPPHGSEAYSSPVDLEIRKLGESGRVAWSARALQPENKVLVVTIPTGSLAPGEYHVLLYRVTAGKPEQPTEYELAIGS
jgi:hypothetical protein